MKKLLLALSLTTAAALSSAQIVSVGNWNQDGYIAGYNVVSNAGAVDVSWSGYETPYNGTTAWRVVVWDMSYSTPIMVANQTFWATSYESSYQRQIPVAPGNAMRVELYATSGQSPNNWPMSRNVATSMWVSPAVTQAATWDNSAPAWNSNQTWNSNQSWNATPSWNTTSITTSTWSPASIWGNRFVKIVP